MKKFLDVEGVCEYTTLSKSSIYKKVRNDQIPHHKIGPRTIFNTEEIDIWIINNGSMIESIPDLPNLN